MVVVLVLPCPLALRVWWSWHDVNLCGQWWLAGLQGFGCCRTVLVVGAGGGGAVCVPRGSGRGVARCRWTRALLEESHPAGGRAGEPPDLSWSSWPGGCRGRVNSPRPRGGDGERACQRCASRRRASRPLT